MRVIILILLFCSCNPYHLTNKEKKEIKANPPGTVQLKDNLYQDRTEVANIYWREFLSYVNQIDSINYNKNKLLPDTLVWHDVNNVALTEYYHAHPGFNDYPLVGVTYEQAIIFCEWRSKVVNEAITKGKHPNWKFKKVRYRLPTIEEWEYAASGNLNLKQYPYGIKLMEENWGMVLKNIKTLLEK